MWKTKKTIAETEETTEIYEKRGSFLEMTEHSTSNAFHFFSS